MKLPRHADIWLLPYIEDRARKWLNTDPEPVRHVWLTIADHFEPFWNHADSDIAKRRVAEWRRRWPEIAAAAETDHAGRPPQYTFFYPTEQYDPSLIDCIAEIAHDGLGDVEVHVHHDGEGRGDLIQRITSFCDALVHRHGLLRSRHGRTQFGFIHGNWALDNSLPGGRWCGLNDEITILRDLGCYADFTMPSGASPTQARAINTIYWCTDDPDRPKSYDHGVPVRRGQGQAGDLLMIPGPFGLRWKERLLPRMETGEIAAYDLPTRYRVRRWFDLAPRIEGNVFIKLYTHGAREENLSALLGGGLQDLFKLVSEEAALGGAVVHYASAWQMYCEIEKIIKGSNTSEAALEVTSQSNNSVLATKHTCDQIPIF